TPDQGRIVMSLTVEPDLAAEFLARCPGRLYIGGRWVDAASGEVLDTVNPSTGTVITQIARGGAADVERAVDAARAALSGPWSTFTPARRQNVLLAFADLVERHAAELAYLDVID